MKAGEAVERLPAIDVRGVTKIFSGRKVVDSISLRVEEGEVYGFLGPNGSGKTTFIRTLCGLLEADGGEGTCLGINFRSERKEIQRQVGYMTQKFSYYEDLTVEENLDFVARVYGLENRKEKIAAALEEHGLGGRRKQLAGMLSGGWKQRLALVACMLHDPKLLLLDEPTAGVDPKARRDFWDLIHQLSARGLTVLVTTHYMDEAERCHRIAYLAYGQMLAKGTVAEVIRGAGLHTWQVSGEKVAVVAESLKRRDGVEQVTIFGNTLHASGSDAVALEAAVRGEAGEGMQCQAIPSGLEDVFIYLMGKSADNFGK